MVWVGRDFKDHLILTPCHGEGQLPLDLSNNLNNLITVKNYQD